MRQLSKSTYTDEEIERRMNAAVRQALSMSLLLEVGRGPGLVKVTMGKRTIFARQQQPAEPPRCETRHPAVTDGLNSTLSQR